jgi:hypothetical protein
VELKSKIFVILLFLLFLWFITGSDFKIGGLQHAWKRWKFDREIILAGQNKVTINDLKNNLPLNKSNLWWYLNKELIENFIENDILIEDAVISLCPRWACFKISIKEKKAYATIDMLRAKWLISKEGLFLTPLPSQNLPSWINKLPKIENILFDSNTINSKARLTKINDKSESRSINNLSADIILGRVLNIIDQLKKIKSEIDLKVIKIVLRGLGDYVVYFSKLSFPVVFSGYDESGKNEPLIIEQLKRLKILMPKLEREERKIIEVDLGFNKVAVVRFEK